MEGVTRESVRPLLDLQKIDSAMDRLTLRKANLPEQQELDALVEQRSELAGRNAEQQSVLDAAVREQTKLETDIQQVQDKIDKEQARLYGGDVNSPKELSNIQAELDSLRRRKIHLEDQELEVMERREGIEAEANTLSSSLAELETAVAEVTVRRDRAASEIEQELDTLRAQREALVPTIDAELLEMYERLRGKFGGVAIGALEGGTCKACGLPLSPVSREEIRSGDDPLPRCENCRRILVVV
ncbi:MAG TPA: C4-type zinc ribbon domain-containing protein [Actinomycetota bacterium]|nr:C4-type zinc ribbon domain-containing protein [Actinomycetota bacterium]